jgi:hypothetical protein
MSQANVEKKLDNFLREFREGKRQDSLISVQTSDSLGKDEREIWRKIRKELKEIGITVAAFDANKDFIFEWFGKAVASGAFEEQPPKEPLFEEPSKEPLFEEPSTEPLYEEPSKEPLFEEPIPLFDDGSKRTRPSGHGVKGALSS